MISQLLCTLTKSSQIKSTVNTIVDSYDIMYNKIFILENREDSQELLCTYNIEKSANHKKLDQTISLHRKKYSNTLYTINALNVLIQSLNNGVLDTRYQVEWNDYKDCVLLTNDNGLHQINTIVNEIIYIQ